MALVSAKCTNCGANLKVDSEKEAAVCEFCDSAYIVEKAINNFSINNAINNISDSVVNIYAGNVTDFVVRAGTLEKYVGALADVVIPDNVTTISKNAFENCTGLTSIIMPNSVTSIEAYAFKGCNKLTSVKLSDNLTEIRSNTFQGCGLTSIDIPNGVRFIDKCAFFACRNLETVTMPDSVTSAGEGTFWDCTSLKNIKLSDKLSYITIGMFNSCVSLESITLPKAINEIYDFAFGNCYELTTINVPMEVESIWVRKNDIFCGCNKLKNINGSQKIIDKLSEFFPERQMYYSSKKQGCYIATAVYNSYDCPEVWTLRRFRDNNLKPTYIGRVFIKIYYLVSPILVKYFGKTKCFKKLFEPMLTKLVRHLNSKGVSSTAYYDN